MKKIVAIVGSASQHSSNLKLVQYIAAKNNDHFSLDILDNLNRFPHFSPELSNENTPTEILEFKQLIENADGVLICTPEYIFSIPSALKNILEWSVSTTIFSKKPLGIITASAQGEKAHEELQLIMKTLMAKFVPETTLLIQGIKDKIDKDNQITDSTTTDQIERFFNAFHELVMSSDKG